MQERDGFIAQPWSELYFTPYHACDGLIRNITIGGGVWASWHTKETLASDDPEALYETDWYPLLSIGLAGNLTLTTTYFFYTSPNDAFKTVQELNLKLAWDDSETLGRFALAPYVNFAIETKNDRTSWGRNEGSGVQLGIAPTLYDFEHDRFPVTFTLPVEVGLSMHDYYEDAADGDEDVYGYTSFGVLATMPLKFIPEGAGTWTFKLSGKGYHFSNDLAEANKNDNWWPVGMAGLAVEF
jgi:hypothetical protein